MLQLLLHLWSDYGFQPGPWANQKRTNIKYAAYHGLQYGLLFLLAGWVLPDSVFQCSLAAFAVITVTHIAIDRFYPARYLIWIKNWLGGERIEWCYCQKTGYDAGVPPWLAVWLMIIVDNTMHLTINYAALSLL